MGAASSKLQKALEHLSIRIIDFKFENLIINEFKNI